MSVVIVAASLSALGCSDGDDTAAGSVGCDADSEPARTASCVESFTPGEGAGHGQDAFPDNVFGEPHGAGDRMGNANDVLSLGKGGEIILGFGGNTILDGEGADFLVFENAFYAFGDPNKPYNELAEVSVSADGTTWILFPCAKDLAPYSGCAGKTPVYANPDTAVSPFDPAVAGGDPYDLAEIGLTEARLIRIQDKGEVTAAPNAGFDLDAIAIIHSSHP